MTTNRFLDFRRMEEKQEEKPTLLLFTGQGGLRDMTDVISTRQVYTLNYNRLSVERQRVR